MQIRVKHLGTPKNPVLPFPKLMINERKNLIVLFTAESTGCVITDGSTTCEALATS